MFGTPESLARVHEMVPHLTMVVAHMGGFLVWEQAREFLIGSDVYLDTAYCLPQHISDGELVPLIRAPPNGCWPTTAPASVRLARRAWISRWQRLASRSQA